MLYGEIDFIEELMLRVKEMEEEHGFKIIGGSTIGSISKGIKRKDSDYDIRFMYINSSGKLLTASERHVGKKIRVRRFSESDIYDCVPCWEISAFINFMSEPYIDGSPKYHLIRNVIWSFQSMYEYDPFGIMKQIRENVLSMVDIEWEKNFFYEKLQGLIKNIVKTRKEGLELMHTILTFRWLIEENTLPPLQIQALACKGTQKELFIIDSLMEDNDRVLVEKEVIESLNSVILSVKEYLKMHSYQDKVIDLNECKDNTNKVQRILETIESMIVVIPME